MMNSIDQQTIRSFRLENLLKDTVVDDEAEKIMIENEIIQQIMAFRGRAHIEHEKKLKLQKDATVSSVDAEIRQKADDRMKAITQDSAQKLVYELAQLLQSSLPLNSEIDRVVSRSIERCHVYIKKSAEDYYGRKKTTALTSIQKEVSSIYEGVDESNEGISKTVEDIQAMSKSTSSSTVQLTLKEKLGHKINAMLAHDLGSLQTSIPTTDQKTVAEVIESQQLNLHLAAKIALLKSMT